MEDFFTVGSKILIIDDSAVTRAVCISMLKRAGYETHEAADAMEGMRMALEGKFDLVLMDIVMPEINGIEACKKFKADPKLRDIPIIMTTMAEEAEYLKDAFEAGAVDYISKPVRNFELQARLKSALMLKSRELELVDKNQKLEKALKEINVLQGFIPVCAWCRKIRDMQGSWQQMEAYIEEHSLARFSHGICKTCSDANKVKYQKEKEKKSA